MPWKPAVQRSRGVSRDRCRPGTALSSALKHRPVTAVPTTADNPRVMSKWPRWSAATATAVAVVAGLVGCGNTERALTLSEVKASMHAAGLKHLHVLTYNSTVAEQVDKSFPEVVFKTED